ncbi:MAG: 2-oxoglutarate dehydrogenase E1 component [Planctomycetota bacterium]
MEHSSATHANAGGTSNGQATQTADPSDVSSTSFHTDNGSVGSAAAALTGAGAADYLDTLYDQYKEDPGSVGSDWQAFFAGFDLAGGDSGSLPKLDANAADTPLEPQLITRAMRGFGQLPSERKGDDALPLTLGVYDLVHTYREFGHFSANIDPLGLPRDPNPYLALENFGATEADLSRNVGNGTFAGHCDGTFGDLVEKLRATYCGNIGIELTGMVDKAQRDWLTNRIEPVLSQPDFNDAQKKQILFELIAAEEFEHYLARTFKGAKRFSIEGAEALVPLMNIVADDSRRHGAKAMVCAMAHRGRLNVLAHVLNKPYEVMLSEFAGTNELPQGVDGDVKYHLGYANTREITMDDGSVEPIKVSLLPNPSHLELINPIQQGIIRCKQEWDAGGDRTKIVPVCIHGDAAFCGQGSVAETLALSELPGFETGGTIHIIANNQIGFTTPPAQSRFTPYATDVAKTIGAPVFHVNGDDPEAVCFVAQLAVEFRQLFKQDVIIDVYCYRRHGHNEADEPRFTQPEMYELIDNHPSVRTLYQQTLIDEGTITEEDAEQMKQSVLDRLDKAREQSKETKVREKVPSFSGAWKGLGPAPRFPEGWNPNTAVSAQVLREVIDRAYQLPDGFTPHDKVEKTVIAARRAAVETGEKIDFGCAEMLALGSLLLEGTSVRFTGQDVERGTFSHRHAVLHDVNTGENFIPLCSMAALPDVDRGDFEIRNTMLSELACLGFEWGYASADPRNLVIWEAQFGDFVNGAQTIIDQILVAAESKWQYMNGLVLLLPHGYEGMGPEHSNAYLERWLSLCAEQNMQVVNPSTAAQHFHALRRQVVRSFRKPLIVMSPKSLLRLPAARSTLDDLTNGGFKMIIDDPRFEDTEAKKRDGVTRVLLCSGRIYHALEKARAAAERDDIAVVRAEQLYPLPADQLADIVGLYRKRTSMSWVQEEPANRGAWSFIRPRLQALFPDDAIEYAGRGAAASPAVGSAKLHEREEKDLLAEALDLTS